jgi:hypothetical protein
VLLVQSRGFTDSSAEDSHPELSGITKTEMESTATAGAAREHLGD